MEAAGLGIGLLGLATLLFKTGLECYEILSDGRAVSKDHDNFLCLLQIEKVRFKDAEKLWGFESGKPSSTQDSNDQRYLCAVRVLVRIVRLFADAEALNSKYCDWGKPQTVKGKPSGTTVVRTRDRISESLHSFSRKADSSSKSMETLFTMLSESSSLVVPPQRLGRDGINTLANPSALEMAMLVPDLEEEVSRIKRFTQQFQEVLPFYRKVQWVVIDKSRSEELITKLKSYNDGLLNVLPRYRDLPIPFP